jgi:hypothetical protein
MRLLKAIAPLALLTVLSACVSAPPIQQPIKFDSAASYELFRSPVLDQTNHTLQHLNQSKDILYYQTYGGGGVGLGLLGPLGVAANIKMIESNTMKDVALLKDKVPVAPSQVFSNAAAKAGISIQSNAGNNVRLNPYLLIEKTENNVIMLASAILVEGADAKSKTPYKYLIQLPLTYSVETLSALDAAKSQELETAVGNGFLALFSRMKDEASANPESEQKIKVTSEFLSPRFAFEMQGSLIEKDQDYTWVRLIGGVFGVKNTDISVKAEAGKKQKTKTKKSK